MDLEKIKTKIGAVGGLLIICMFFLFIGMIWGDYIFFGKLLVSNLVLVIIISIIHSAIGKK